MIHIAADKNKKIFDALGSFFFNLSDTSEDVYWVRSPDLRKFIYISPKAKKLYGVSADALYQDPTLWHSSVLPEDRDKIRQTFMECIAGGAKDISFKLDYRIHLPSGGVASIRELGSPIFSGRKCLGYAGFSREASLAKSAEKDLQLAFFANFFIKALDSVFWVRDKTGEKQLYVSPALKAVWGLDPKKLYEQPQLWDESIFPEDRKPFPVNLTAQQERRFRITRVDGEIRWIKNTLFPIHDEQGEIFGYAGIADDITEDVLREKELLEAKEKAEQANQAKSDFLAMMSHELRTPLNAILGMSQILKTSTLTENQQDQIDVIAQSGQNLLGLLNDILDFAKLEVGKLSFSNEEFDLLSLLQKLVVDLKPSSKEKNLQFELEVEDSLPRYVTGDPKRLRQVLVNLVSNAVKYTQVGGIHLRVRCLQRNSKEGTFSFTVDDTGIGIPKEKLDTIFQRFQQVDSVYIRKHEGVGLGLAIVKELVGRMGGSIAVNSKEGEGSHFTCVLPMGIREQDCVPSDLARNLGESTQQFTQFNAKVLIVEDNPINQKIAAALLEQLGCIVDVVDNGEAALRKFQDGYDIVFLDIGLPDVDGFTVGKRMREQELGAEHVPIIALTAHVFAQDRKRCFDVGMDEVMAKPIMRDDLISVLARWFKKDTH